MRDRGSRWSPQCLVTSQILQLWLSQARAGKVVSSLQGWPANPGREPPDPPVCPGLPKAGRRRGTL